MCVCVCVCVCVGGWRSLCGVKKLHLFLHSLDGVEDADELQALCVDVAEQVLLLDAGLDGLGVCEGGGQCEWMVGAMRCLVWCGVACATAFYLLTLESSSVLFSSRF